MVRLVDGIAGNKSFLKQIKSHKSDPANGSVVADQKLINSCDRNMTKVLPMNRLPLFFSPR